MHSDDASMFSYSEAASQNSQGSAKLLQQLMGVRLYAVYVLYTYGHLLIYL